MRLPSTGHKAKTSVAARYNCCLIACCEQGFAFRRFWEVFRVSPIPPFPVLTSVPSYKYGENVVDGIADQDTVIFTACVISREFLITKAYCVPKAVFIGVGEEQHPRVTSVGGFVQPLEVAFAGGHDDGCVGVEGLYAT